MRKMAFGIVAVVFIAASARAQFTETRLSPDDLTSSALFGFALASNQQILAVGAPTRNAVYVYLRNSSNWTLDAEITAFGAGSGVAVDGSTLALSSSSGVLLYAQQNGTWTQIAQIATPVSITAIAMNKGRIAAAGAGKVFVFERDELTESWSQTATLSGSAAGTFTGFGFNLALSDNTLIVTEPFLNNGTGAAHVYAPQNGTWIEHAVLHPATPAAATLFGIGLSISGNTAVVGAPGEGMSGEADGSAFVFVNNNGAWTQQAEIDSPMTAGGEEFGTSVALIGNALLVGAYEADAEIGNAIIYNRSGNTWTQAGSLFPSDGMAEQRFANSVTMPDGNTFVCGSPTATDPGKFNAGAVYVYEK